MNPEMAQFIAQPPEGVAGGRNFPPKRMVALSCVLSLFSFMIVFSQTILNWLLKVSSDDQFWENAIRLASTIRDAAADTEDPNVNVSSSSLHRRVADWVAR